MKKIAKKTYFRPVFTVIDLPCKVLLNASASDPYAGEETIDIPLDIPTDPDEGTYDAL